MGWNFYIRSKIRQKTKKIDMMSMWRNFGQFFNENLRIFFTTHLVRNFEKNWRHLDFFSIFELKIFFYNFWQKIRPIWTFLGNLWHFNVSPVLY